MQDNQNRKRSSGPVQMALDPATQTSSEGYWTETPPHPWRRLVINQDNTNTYKDTATATEANRLV